MSAHRFGSFCGALVPWIIMGFLVLAWSGNL